MNFRNITDEERERFFTTLGGEVTVVPAVSLELLMRLAADSRMFDEVSEQLSLVQMEKEDLEEENAELKSANKKLEADLESYKKSSMDWWMRYKDLEEKLAASGACCCHEPEKELPV